MAIVERDIIHQGVDESGNTTIDFPLARLGWIEGSAGIKAAPTVEDYIPIVDAADGDQVKKAALPALAEAAGLATREDLTREVNDLAVSVFLAFSSGQFELPLATRGGDEICTREGAIINARTEFGGMN